jgi:NADH-quinone oxidoreductase subunit G
MQKLGIAAGQQVMVNEARVPAALDDGVPDECVRLATAHPSTIGAGAMFGAVKVEKATVERAA